MEKIIKLEGRIDSNNANEIETQIAEEVSDFAGNLVFDATNLEYISSAGLRMILRFKKDQESLKIVNCSTEVYDIFEMTGFSEMMEISKKIREISIDGCELIGDGFFGKVYRINPEIIVKVYKKPDSLNLIKRERELARKAFVLGIPTAIPYDIVKVGDLYGAVFELIDAKNLAKLIREGTDIRGLVKDCVSVLKKIHETELKPGELPSKRQEKIQGVKDVSKYLSKDVSERLIKLMEDVPETNTMLHGDFHIKNIMYQNGEILIIDMDSLSLGHPIFELGAMTATYEGYACIDKNNPQDFLGITMEQSEEILGLTYKYYFEGKDEEYIESVKEKARIHSFFRT